MKVHYVVLYQMVNLEPNRGDAVKGAKWGDPSSEVDDVFIVVANLLSAQSANLTSPNRRAQIHYR